MFRFQWKHAVFLTPLSQAETIIIRKDLGDGHIIIPKLVNLDEINVRSMEKKHPWPPGYVENLQSCSFPYTFPEGSQWSIDHIFGKIKVFAWLIMQDRMWVHHCALKSKAVQTTEARLFPHNPQKALLQTLARKGIFSLLGPKWWWWWGA